jgi:hypothetical protein
LEITPLQRAQIVELAYLEPVAKGLHITHWSSQDLARQAVADRFVAHISPRTVRKILRDVDLQPHRTRYWKTPRLDARFKDRAEQVLWCYGNAARLAEQGIWVVCVDEIPTFQILERHPIRRAISGSIEQQEFDYTRHGTVNMLVFLVVHTGLVPVHESMVTSVQMASSREVASRMLRPSRPTRARRPSDASVDPTEARNATGG